MRKLLDLPSGRKTEVPGEISGEVKDVEKEKKGLKNTGEAKAQNVNVQHFNMKIVDLLEPLGLFFFSSFFSLRLFFAYILSR